MSVPRRVRRRDRLFIMAEVLHMAKKPLLKTQIMYRATLSFAQLNDFLSTLLDLNLLEVIKDKEGHRTAYRTTEKGLQFLNAYGEVRELLKKETWE